jgi:hypothetical protein
MAPPPRSALAFLAMRRVPRTHCRLAGTESTRWQSCSLRPDCMIPFGKRWRGDAFKALVALGLEPPDIGDGQRTCRASPLPLNGVPRQPITSRIG